MENSVFKNIFSKVAREHGFSSAHGCWYIESGESLVVLELQKSNFANRYLLNIKVTLQGLFGNVNKKSKDELRNSETTSRQPPQQYNETFDLGGQTNEEIKEAQIRAFFGDFMSPLANKAMTRQGVKELDANKELWLAEGVRSELMKLL
jgi:hypothetical protein